MPTPVVHPVQTLRAHSTSFSVALEACLADPTIRAVHKLRTESRRLAAQIGMLRALRGLPSSRNEARKALWQIRKLRQAAGQVRDLDVQTAHLAEHAAKSRSGSLSQAAKLQLSTDIDQMLAQRAERRETAGTQLLKEIGRRQAKATSALDKLSSALDTASETALPGAELMNIIDKQFARTHARHSRSPSADDLHTVRKAAKQARYLAENAGTAEALEAAKRYEHLQELGGEWHDWLDLTGAARKELGKKHVVTAEFAELRDRNLETFRAELKCFIEGAEKPTRQGCSVRRAPRKVPRKKPA